MCVHKVIDWYPLNLEIFHTRKFRRALYNEWTGSLFWAHYAPIKINQRMRLDGRKLDKLLLKYYYKGPVFYGTDPFHSFPGTNLRRRRTYIETDIRYSRRLTFKLWHLRGTWATRKPLPPHDNRIPWVTTLSHTLFSSRNQRINSSSSLPWRFRQ